jgi:ribonuclease R
LIVHRVLSALLEQAPGNRDQAPGNRHQPPERQRGLDSEGGFASEIGPGFSPDISRRKNIGASAPGIPLEEIASIATESSEAERRADDAERELIEWKKIRFMEDRIGGEFDAIVLSVTKFGMFVELENLFLEGLVPLQSLSDLGERFFYRENTRQLMGEDSGRKFAIGDRVRVLLDKIQRMERRLIFAVLEDSASSGRKNQIPIKSYKSGHAFAPTRTGKAKSKGKKKSRR